MSRQGSMFKLTIIVLVVVLVLVYAFFNTRLLIAGPKVEVFDLNNGQIIESDLVEVNGKAENISFISLNGRQIFLDQENLFKEKVLLSNQITTISLYAKDKFDREIKKEIVLIKKEGLESDLENAKNIQKELLETDELDEDENLET